MGTRYNYAAMMRRESRKLEVEMRRFAASGAKHRHLPLFAQLMDNHFARRARGHQLRIRHKL